MNINNAVNRIFEAYVIAKAPLPAPRALALRLLEEAVELALACGASVEDTHTSVGAALRNEQEKDPLRLFDQKCVESNEEIAGEIADVCLLASAISVACSTNAEINEFTIEIAASDKTYRLIKAAVDGTLLITPDGRFYRRAKI